MDAMYSPQLLDHFENPRNVGEVAAPDASVRIENPACGDIMELSCRVRENLIAEIRYRTRGCVAAIACGSAMTEMMSGKSLNDARLLTREELVAAVGGLRPESIHASHLAMDAKVQLLRQIP